MSTSPAMVTPMKDNINMTGTIMTGTIMTSTGTPRA